MLTTIDPSKRKYRFRPSRLFRARGVSDAFLKDGVFLLFHCLRGVHTCMQTCSVEYISYKTRTMLSQSICRTAILHITQNFSVTITIQIPERADQQYYRCSTKCKHVKHNEMQDHIKVKNKRPDNVQCTVLMFLGGSKVQKGNITFLPCGSK